MPRPTMTALFSYARAAVACVALGLAFAPSAFAVGGDDLNTGTKVNAATQACQAKIAAAGASYAAKAAAAMNACLDAIVKCDEQADATKALTCRRALLVQPTGKCAVGKVDEGASMLGNGAAAHADSLPLSKAVLLAQMRTYSNTLQKKCFTPADVDLESVATGLGFSPEPLTKLALADATNQDPGGIQCLANGLVLKTHPLADEITQLVEDLHGQCVVSKDLTKLGTACTVDADCDGTVAASGRCGALAKVFRQGSIKPCAAPPVGVAVCGNGIAEYPEKCDDGNVLNGDGCSESCTLEPAHQLLSTGQTTCWNAAGTVISCGGTGQDGDLQKGAPLAYVDNGDGTITDSKTGLMWEKLDDNNVGGIHDFSNIYTWANAFVVKITTLNAGSGLGGHKDWRLPNVKEFESLINYGRFAPAVDPAFNTNCVPGCTTATCSCTYLGNNPIPWYWSSTTFVGLPSQAWVVDFYNGSMGPISSGTVADFKTSSGNFVRAVRGGP